MGVFTDQKHCSTAQHPACHRLGKLWAAPPLSTTFHHLVFIIRALPGKIKSPLDFSNSFSVVFLSILTRNFHIFHKNRKRGKIAHLPPNDPFIYLHFEYIAVSSAHRLSFFADILPYGSKYPRYNCWLWHAALSHEPAHCSASLWPFLWPSG